LPEDPAAPAEGSTAGLWEVELSIEVASVELLFNEVLFNKVFLIVELFTSAGVSPEPPRACTALPPEIEDAARFKSPMYTIDPPGDHWAEALQVKAMNITARTRDAFLAVDISIGSLHTEIRFRF